MIQVLRKSTGEVVGVFDDYMRAAVFRRDELDAGPDEYLIRGVA